MTTLGVIAACLLAGRHGRLPRPPAPPGAAGGRRVRPSAGRRGAPGRVPAGLARTPLPARSRKGSPSAARVLAPYGVLDDPAWTARSARRAAPRRRTRAAPRGYRPPAAALRAGGDLASRDDCGRRAAGRARSSSPSHLNALAGSAFGDAAASRALGLHAIRPGPPRRPGRTRPASSGSRPRPSRSARRWIATGTSSTGSITAGVRTAPGRPAAARHHGRAPGHLPARPPELRELTCCSATATSGWASSMRPSPATAPASRCGPICPGPIVNRGLAHLDIRDYRGALADFDRVDRAAARHGRGVYQSRRWRSMGLGDFSGAIADLDHALEQPDAPVRALFLRATARERLGDRAGGRQDRAEGLRRRPDDEVSWVAPRPRTAARPTPRAPWPTSTPPWPSTRARSPPWRTRRTSWPNGSAARRRPSGCSTAALLHHPDDVEGRRAGRGVYHARLGRRDAALADARAALATSDQAFTIYQVAGIYALTSRQQPEDRREALRLLAIALRKDASWLRVLPGRSRPRPDPRPARIPRTAPRHGRGRPGHGPEPASPVARRRNDLSRTILRELRLDQDRRARSVERRPSRDSRHFFRGGSCARSSDSSSRRGGAMRPLLRRSSAMQHDATDRELPAGSSVLASRNEPC